MDEFLIRCDCGTSPALLPTFSAKNAMASKDRIRDARRKPCSLSVALVVTGALVG